MTVDALLCDAARVRDRLLSVIGAGITRMSRPSYPGPLEADLAIMFTLEPSEAQDPHRVRVIVQSEDGKEIAKIDGEFKVTRGKGAKAWERLAVPMVFPVRGLPIPKAGVYSIELLVDSHSVRSLVFTALQTEPEKGKK